MDTDFDAEFDDQPEPRPARAQSERRHRRIRFAVGAAMLLLGVGVTALAVKANDSSSSGERPVGKLIADGDDETAVKASEEDDPSTTTAETTSGPTLGEPKWPSNSAGRPPAFGVRDDPPPASADGLEDGFYLWQDFDGWHLWLVGGTDADRVTITADSEMPKADATDPGALLERTPNSFVFGRGGSGAEVVGVDFNPGYYAKTVVVSTEGGLALRLGAGTKAAPTYLGLQYSAAST